MVDFSWVTSGSNLYFCKGEFAISLASEKQTSSHPGAGRMKKTCGRADIGMSAIENR
jgi:hypothetical protein